MVFNGISNIYLQMTNNFKFRFFRHTIFSIFGLIYTPGIAAQIIENVDFIVENEKILVYYDLVNCKGDRSYDIKLFYTDQTGFSEAVSVEGNLINQSCGKKKVISWEVLKDKNELKGKVQFEVKIVRSYSTKRLDMFEEDKAYIGVSLGIFNPVSHSLNSSTGGIPSDNLEQRGNSMDILLALRLKGAFGITGSLRFSNTMRYANIAGGDTYWENFGYTVGPLFSYPLSSNVYFDLRAMIGYSRTLTYPGSNKSLFFDNGDGLGAGAFTKTLGGVLRFNWEESYYYFVSIDYFSASPKFSGQLTRNLQNVGFNIGAAIRFN